MVLIRPIKIFIIGSTLSNAFSVAGGQGSGSGVLQEQGRSAEAGSFELLLAPASFLRHCEEQSRSGGDRQVSPPPPPPPWGQSARAQKLFL